MYSWRYVLAVTIFTILGMFMYMRFFPEKVRAEEIDLSIIAKIESNGNPNAYNEHSGAVGLYQITPICLQEYNQCMGKQSFFAPFGKPNTSIYYKKFITQADLYTPVINEIIAEWYLNTRIPSLLKHYHKPITIDNILWAYNAGIGKVVKGIMPKETKNYIKKYHKLEKERGDK